MSLTVPSSFPPPLGGLMRSLGYVRFFFFRCLIPLASDRAMCPLIRSEKSLSPVSEQLYEDLFFSPEES